MLHEEFHLCGGNRASCSGVLIVVNVLLQYRDRSTGTPLLIELSEFIAPVNSPNAIMPDDQVAPASYPGLLTPVFVTRSANTGKAW